MRLLITNLLVAGMLLFGAASASAYAIRGTTPYDGHDVVASETIEINIWLDTEGASSIRLITLGVVFDNTQLTFDPVASAAEGYMLYSAAAGANPSVWLAPEVPNTHAPLPPAVVGGAFMDQVNVNMGEHALGQTYVTATNAHMATLIFHVTNPTATSQIWLTIDGSRGGTVFALGDTSTPPVGLSAPIDVNVNVVPEPTTALLIGLGLVGLGVAGRRRE